MSTTSKILGLVAGVSTVAVIGVAVAQGVPPDPRIPNHPIAAGQQSSQNTAMGDTGVPAWETEIRAAAIPAAVVVTEAPPAPAPVTVVEAAPEPAPAPVVMGAPAAPEPVQVAEAPVARADRN